MPLFDEAGKRVRGVGAKQTAGLALARVRLKQGLKPESEPEQIETNEAWSVARVCSVYLDHCAAAVAGGRLSDVCLPVIPITERAESSGVIASS